MLVPCAQALPLPETVHLTQLDVKLFKSGVWKAGNLAVAPENLDCAISVSLGTFFPLRLMSLRRVDELSHLRKRDICYVHTGDPWPGFCSLLSSYSSALDPDQAALQFAIRPTAVLCDLSSSHCQNCVGPSAKAVALLLAY